MKIVIPTYNLFDIKKISINIKGNKPLSLIIDLETGFIVESTSITRDIDIYKFLTVPKNDIEVSLIDINGEIVYKEQDAFLANFLLPSKIESDSEFMIKGYDAEDVKNKLMTYFFPE